MGDPPIIKSVIIGYLISITVEKNLKDRCKLDQYQYK